MEAHPRTLKNVFRSDVRLTVPLFQRPYVWNADDQWQPLWEDVLATRDRVARSEHTAHFLGAIVLQLKPGALGSLEVREIIDGQQRLATLQLLIAAIRDAFVEHAVEDRSLRRLTKLLRNDPDLVDDPDDEHKLWPTNRDRDVYRAVMRGDYRDASLSDTLPRIAQAYIWFHTAVDDLLQDTPQDDMATVLTGLAEVLFEYLEVVVIDLTEDDNAQIIFETLNARGTALRASDLIKNLLFRTLQDARWPVEELYTRHWAPLETPAWQVDVRQGRLSRPRLDAFMGHFLVVLLQREVQAHQLFPASRTFVQSDPRRAETFLAETSRYSRVYDQIETLRTDDQTEFASLTRMLIADTQTLMPLLLWLFANTAGSERRDALRALESYVVRRTLCRLTSKNYNRLFLELLRRLGSGDRPVDKAVTSYLAEQGSESGMWPTDAELTRSLQDLPLYRLLKRDRLQRTLLALEIAASTSRTELINTTHKLSVEHLLPQRWEDNWPLPPDPVEAEHVRSERDRLVHTLGNLTLVTGTLNATMSNAGWSTKHAHLLQNSALTLNRSLPDRWDTDTIRVRGDYLARLAAWVWPRPAPTQGAPEFAADSERDLRPERDAAPPVVDTNGGGRSGRHDIGKHIDYVFKDLPAGQFLTIAEIRRRPSPEYTDTAPSAGAIAARLFPQSGRTTVASVRPDVHNGVRGATKV